MAREAREGIPRMLRPYPTITHYIAYFENRKKTKKPITELTWLEDHLRHEGIHSLRRLLFQFDRPSLSYYFPYSAHNVVLEKIPPCYHFEYRFYHYYTVQNERVDIPSEQQYYDVCAIRYLFYQRPILFYYLFDFLNEPVFLPLSLPLPPLPPLPPLSSFSSFPAYSLPLADNSPCPSRKGPNDRDTSNPSDSIS